MILITGGFGFIGSHTTRAVLDLGESCVLTQRSSTRLPDFLAGELGTRLFVEQADLAEPSSLTDIGKKHRITGIIHLAAARIGTLHPIEEIRVNIQGLLNVLQAGLDWGVPRVAAASTIGVYIGASDGPYREDAPLPMAGFHSIPAAKKSAEIISDLVARQTGIEVVNLRIGAIWGPLGHPESPFFAAPQLVHAAVRGEPISLAGSGVPGYAEDGIDMCYARDCGRAIALLQTADTLNHRTYNVGAGRATTNREVADAIRTAVPEARIEILDGRDPDRPAEPAYLDTERLRRDTGYRPEYDTERGVADYVGWLRAGHDR